MKGDILITEKIEGSALEILKKDFIVVYEPEIWFKPELLQEIIGKFRGLIVRNQTQVTADLIKKASSLEVIGRAGAGLDNIDIKAASMAGIVVVNTPEQNSISVAELTMGLMLALARHICVADRDTKTGGWHRKNFTGSELYNRTLGIIGLGKIGFRTARRARTFGMDIIIHDKYANSDGLTVSELRAPLVSLPDLLKQADYVSCHLPLTVETKDLFDYKKFCIMKSSAFFINTSRGQVVKESDLIQALKEGQIAGAALDVRSKEPPGVDAFEKMDNVILTPHIAAFTGEAQNRVVSSVCQDITKVLNGIEAGNFVNFARPQTDNRKIY